ncbi:OLC1v1017471C1 [Oldenlandia corymbosa var. corymbosa]|uniref:OLC1v1017471C1 n=1 Tax=Oldenlandia corymbosa var. corymbosa TaxID=529605 RepID=A0AAV1E9Q3_OLDCO|nr:OLC1v1017471C1 [Oldenlandia corymbosa var. corymbosa]
MREIIKFSLCVAFLITAVVADETSNMTKSEQDVNSCITALFYLVPCSSYLEFDSMLSKPSHECCGELETLLSINPSCTCIALENTMVYAFGVDIHKVLTLPKLCDVKNIPPEADCNIFTTPAPSPSVPTHSPSTTPGILLMM